MNATTQISEVTFPPYTLTGGVAYRELQVGDTISGGDQYWQNAKCEWKTIAAHGLGHKWHPVSHVEFRRRLAPSPDNYRAMQAAWLSHFNVGVGSRVRFERKADPSELGWCVEDAYFPDWEVGEIATVVAIYPGHIFLELDGGRGGDVFPFHVLAPVPSEINGGALETVKAVPERGASPETLSSMDKTPPALSGPEVMSAAEAHSGGSSRSFHPPAVPEGQGEVRQWIADGGAKTNDGPFFVDTRIGCIAIREKSKTDSEYQGLHSDTPGVVWYRGGDIWEEERWSVSAALSTEAERLCATMNCGIPESPTPAIERGEEGLKACLAEARDTIVGLNDRLADSLGIGRTAHITAMMIGEVLAGTFEYPTTKKQEYPTVAGWSSRLALAIKQGKASPEFMEWLGDCVSIACETGVDEWVNDEAERLVASTKLLMCDTCRAPRRSVAPCHKCGGPLREACEGWEEPRLPSIDRIRELAKEVGYAIGVHGSLERDLDLIATPWSDGAVDPKSLAQHIAKGLSGTVIAEEQKPLGRWSCNIQANGYFKLIDLSVAPSKPTPTPSAGQEDDRFIEEEQTVLRLHDKEVTARWVDGVRSQLGGDGSLVYLIRLLQAELADLRRQVADDDRLQCCNGCRHYTGGDVRHHPSCKWYPESLTKMQDQQESELTRLRGEVERLTTLTSNMGFVAEHADDQITTLTADLGRAREENERGDRVVVIRKLSEVLQDARFTICCMKEASGEGLVFARKFGAEAVTKIDNAIAFADEGLGRVDGKELDRLINSLRRLQAKRRKDALRPAAKDDEGGGK